MAFTTDASSGGPAKMGNAGIHPRCSIISYCRATLATWFGIQMAITKRALYPYVLVVVGLCHLRIINTLVFGLLQAG
jgi:hypothetical protein